jgi:hypothetical protein
VSLLIRKGGPRTGRRDDHKRRARVLERLLAFNTVVLLLTPLLAVVESLRDQGKDGQGLPHAHLVGQNTTSSLVWLDVLLGLGLCDSVAVPDVVTSAMDIELNLQATHSPLPSSKTTVFQSLYLPFYRSSRRSLTSWCRSTRS